MESKKVRLEDGSRGLYAWRGQRMGRDLQASLLLSMAPWGSIPTRKPQAASASD